MRTFALSALAAAALSVAVPAMSLADISADVRHDLGFDVTSIPSNPVAVRQFMATLPPQGQRAVIGGCQNYLQHPQDVTTPATIPFCQTLIYG